MVCFINNKKFFIKKSERTLSIFQFCSRHGIEIPCFCYYESLSIAGNCRMCLVEVNTARNLVASCAMPLVNNMRIFTDNLRVKKARESVLEFLLINHPLDCPICDQGGECDLQDISLVYGSDKSRFYELKKRVNFNKNLGVFIKTFMSRCILCTRCVRFFKEILCEDNFGILGRGVNSEISTYVTFNLYNIFSGNVVDICPVGALTVKDFSFKFRNWELNSYEFIDIFDCFFNNLKVDIYLNKIVRILPLYVDNKSWITNISRYSFKLLDLNRVSFPYIYDKFLNKFLKISWSDVFMKLFLQFFNYSLKGIINFKILNLFDFNVFANLSYIVKNSGLFFYDFNSYFFDFFDNIIFNFYEKNNYNLVIFFGLNVRMVLPVYSLFLSQKLKNKQITVFSWGFDNFFFNNFLENYFYFGNNFIDFFQFMKGYGKIMFFIVSNCYYFNFLMFFNNVYFFFFNYVKRFLSFFFMDFYFFFFNFSFFEIFNFIPKNSLNLKKLNYKKLNYFFNEFGVDNGSNFFITKSIKNYNVIETPFFPLNRKGLDMILPLNYYFEKSLNLRDNYGILKFSNAILNSVNLEKDNKLLIKFFKKFFYFIFKNIKLNFFIYFYDYFFFFILYFSILNINLSKIFLISKSLNKFNLFIFKSINFEFYSQDLNFLNVKILSYVYRNNLKKGFFNKNF